MFQVLTEHGMETMLNRIQSHFLDCDLPGCDIMYSRYFHCPPLRLRQQVTPNVDNHITTRRCNPEDGAKFFHRHYLPYCACLLFGNIFLLINNFVSCNSLRIAGDLTSLQVSQLLCQSVYIIMSLKMTNFI